MIDTFFRTKYFKVNKIEWRLILSAKIVTKINCTNTNEYILVEATKDIFSRPEKRTEIVAIIKNKHIKCLLELKINIDYVKKIVFIKHLKLTSNIKESKNLLVLDKTYQEYKGQWVELVKRLSITNTAPKSKIQDKKANTNKIGLRIIKKGISDD